MPQAENACRDLPAPEKIRQEMLEVQRLRDIRDALHMQAQLLPPLPPVPVAAEPFQGKTPEQAISDAASSSIPMSRARAERVTISFSSSGV